MTVAIDAPPLLSKARTTDSQKDPSPRLASVDVLRGLIMFTMIFVNDVAGVRDAPWWMKHFHPESANGMTFVDLVFPAFLFIVGLSIPIAMERRIARGDAMWRIALHTLVRTAGLLLLGVFMVNDSADPWQMGWPGGLWELLVYVCAIAAFVSPPAGRRGRWYIVTTMRVAAFAGFFVLWLVYRDHKGHGMQTQWWGILGLIGWAYLIASILYLIFRRERAALMLSGALLTALYIADKRGRFDNWMIGEWIDIGGTLGSQPAITLAGVVLGTVLLDAGMSLAAKLRWSALFGLGLAIGAQLLYRLYGINKNDATPSWCLWASAIPCWLWCIVALVCAARLPRLIAMVVEFFRRGGENVLLAYLLMPVWYALVDLLGWDFYWAIGRQGAAGITRALLAATLCMALSILLTRRGLRLRL